MKSLLEKIEVFRAKPSQQDIELMTTELGDTFSIPLLEEVLKHYKSKEKEILTKDFLEWMQENDLTTLETDNFKVSIATYVSAKVVDTDRAFKWLQDNQYADLIKDTLDFPKGEFGDEVRDALERLGVSYTQKSGIHPQSLKKIMSDRLKSGEQMPEVEDNGIDISYYDECRIKER